MKQLIIGKDVAYAAGADFTDLTTVEDGAIGIYTLSDLKAVTTPVYTKGNVGVVCGRGEDEMPLHFSEVDTRTLTVTKAEYEDGATFTAAVTIPAVEKGKHYTIIVTKTGTVFNERANWTFTSYAKSENSADVAKDLAKQMGANGHTLGIKVELAEGTSKIVITAVKQGDNYTVTCADELIGTQPTDVTDGKVPVLDKAYVQELASKCAAGKGFNYTYRDGDSIYPGYPETVDADKYVLYTLRFAVPRVAAKQRDEVVYQTLHIAVPQDAACVATLDTIFDIQEVEP